ncbi:MAG: hypothetical protein J2P28_02845 [Actinobacteria bacterium]|nr:hypothetical protein [Actinomycetota bacterium]
MTVDLDTLPRPLRDMERYLFTPTRPHHLLGSYREQVWRGPTCDVVLVTETAEPDGLSVTNMIETVYHHAIEEWPNALVVERRLPVAGIPEVFAVITMADGPVWHPITAQVFAALVAKAEAGFTVTVRDVE